MRILITAGPTREPIDAVRFISNRSSGRMGLALTEAAMAAGHTVTLLLGPGPASPTLAGDSAVHRFETAAHLQTLLDEYWPEHDLLIMAAAVADYRPARQHEGKIEREAGGKLVLELEPTPDLVAEAAGRARPGQCIIAFALEAPDELETRAREKLRRKGVDAIVANPLAAMDADETEVLWITADTSERAPGSSKDEVARWIVERAGDLSG